MGNQNGKTDHQGSHYSHLPLPWFKNEGNEGCRWPASSIGSPATNTHTPTYN